MINSHTVFYSNVILTYNIEFSCRVTGTVCLVDFSIPDITLFSHISCSETIQFAIGIELRIFGNYTVDLVNCEIIVHINVAKVIVVKTVFCQIVDNLCSKFFFESILLYTRRTR